MCISQYLFPEGMKTTELTIDLQILEQQLETSQSDLAATLNKLELMESQDDLAKNMELINALADPGRTEEQSISLLRSLRLGISNDDIFDRCQQMLDSEDPDFIHPTVFK